MAKFYGAIGYAETVEKPGSVWEDRITERSYYGDVVRDSRTLRERDEVNDNIGVTNSLSVVADGYAYEHIFAIRYVKWQGTLWKVDEAEVQRPRLLLRLGGVYNGPEPTSS